LKSFTKTSWLLAVPTVVSAMCLSSVSRADDPKPEPDTGGKITITGLIDGYFQYSMNHPKAGTLMATRAFDPLNNSFSLAVAEINVVRAPSKNLPVGFTLTGIIGKTADLFHATEPGTTNTKYLQQIFATYLTQGKYPLTIDIGKFTSWIGYEVPESTSNDNYSRSVLYNLAEPFYHAGIRVTTPLTPKITAGVYIVNGWNNLEDDNGAKTVGTSLAYTAGATNVSLNYIGGNELTGAALPTDLNVQLLNLVASTSVTPFLKVGATADYASAAKNGAGGHWNGQGIYGKYTGKAGMAFAVRGEHFEDSNGLRTGIAQNINEVTLTLEKSWKSSFVTRLEYRHDHAGTAYFQSASGPGTPGTGGSKNNDTITLAHIIKF